MKKYSITVNNNAYEVTINSLTNGVADVEIGGKKVTVKVAEHPSNKTTKTTPVKKSAPAPKKESRVAPVMATGNGIHAPIPGQVRAILVKVGDTVNLGQKVLVMEAMKMQNSIAAKISGVVKAIHVKEGDAAAQNQLLIEVE